MGERLDNGRRVQYRERIEIKFKDIDFMPNHRIELKPEQLDALLFDYDRLGRKVFAFYGEGLCKIDLSTVDFSKVIFEGKKRVNLSNTNVNIDFYDFCMTNGLINKHVIKNIDFSGVDLSESLNRCYKIHTLEFYDCDLSNTGLQINDRQCLFKGCNLSGVDLSFTTLKCQSVTNDGHIIMQDNKPIFQMGGYNVWVNNCNLSGTNAEILVMSEVLSTTVNYGSHGGLHKTVKVNVNEYFANQMAEGKLDGVTFIGTTITPAKKKEPSELTLETRKKRELKDRRLSALINGTLDDIDKQLPSIGGKNRKDAGEKKKEDKTTGSGSFYGCDNVPEVKKTSKGKKLKNTMNPGSFYGCGNVPGEE